MLHKDERISRGKEYKCIYNEGKRIPGQYMIVFVHKNQLPYNRFGIVTSKKIGNAVIRNRAKRQIREVIRKTLNNLRPGYDVVVVARFTMKQAVFALIESDFIRLMGKANLR
jgi:ribonuclease P protein component